MFDTSRLTIIIPTIGERILEDAVAECRRQAPEAEIIVAGANFDPERFKRYHIVPILFEKPMIKTILLNKVFKVVSNDRLVIIDADALPVDGWAENIIRTFESGKQLFCGSVDISQGNFWMKVYNISFFHLFTPDNPAGPRNFVVGCNYAMTKEVYQRNGPFDERLARSGDDYEYTLRAKQNGIQPYFEPAPVIAHIPVDKDSFRKVMRFWYNTGYPTIKVRAMYPQLTKTPAALRSAWFTLLASPLLAIVPTFRVLRSRKKAMMREWIYLPAIYLTKIVWCVGLFAGAMEEKKNGK